jgi:tetratricopeptide (TPR) repeat protein
VAQREPHARWWWYLDEQAAADRKRALIRVGTLVLAGLILVSGLYLLYERFLAPPPQVRQVQAHLFEGEQAAFEHDFARAIREFEAVVELDPDVGEAHLWLGALYQEQGKPVEASRAFEQARSYLGNGPGFLLQRGLLFLSLGDVAAAYNDATSAIQAYPERPEGHFLQGSVAEQVGDLELALAALQKADERAGAVGQQELQVTIRIRIGMILQQLGVQSQP